MKWLDEAIDKRIVPLNRDISSTFQILNSLQDKVKPLEEKLTIMGQGLNILSSLKDQIQELNRNIVGINEIIVKNDYKLENIELKKKLARLENTDVST